MNVVTVALNDVVDFGRRLERLEAAARKVLDDWHAAQAMAGTTVHICSEREFEEGECRCQPDPPAVKWASLTALEEALSDSGALKKETQR